LKLSVEQVDAQHYCPAIDDCGRLIYASNLNFHLGNQECIAIIVSQNPQPPPIAEFDAEYLSPPKIRRKNYGALNQPLNLTSRESAVKCVRRRIS